MENINRVVRPVLAKYEYNFFNIISRDAHTGKLVSYGDLFTYRHSTQFTGFEMIVP